MVKVTKVRKQTKTQCPLQPSAATDTTCTTSPGYALFSNSKHIFIPHIFSLQGGCQQLGRTGVLPNCFPTHFCWRFWTVLGLKERAGKSSFLPAEGSGTHKPASKCVRLNCKQKIHGVQTKPRVQNHNSTA